MLEGADISQYQGTPDWAAVKASGRINFVIMRATYGLTGIDAQFKANQAGVRSVGLPCGFYHFANGYDAVAEAQHFVATVGPLKPGETLWLDDEIVQPEHNAWACAFLDVLRPHVGIPGIYSNISGFKNIGPIANCVAWLAFPGPAPLPPPPGYTSAQTLVNQTHTTTLPGIPGSSTDVDYLLADSIDVFTSWGAPEPLTEESMFLATTTRTAAQGQDPHGAGAVYLCEGIPTQPGMFKRWFSGVDAAALPDYVTSYGAVVQNYDAFKLDRMIELAPIDLTTPTLQQVAAGGTLTADQAAALAAIPGLVTTVNAIAAKLNRDLA